MLASLACVVCVRQSVSSVVCEIEAVVTVVLCIRGFVSLPYVVPIGLGSNLMQKTEALWP